MLSPRFTLRVLALCSALLVMPTQVGSGRVARSSLCASTVGECLFELDSRCVHATLEEQDRYWRDS